MAIGLIWGLDTAYTYDFAYNMQTNSALCTTTILYPDPNSTTADLGGGSGTQPHAQSSICSIAHTYDKNGNTLTYDGDGTAANVLPRSFAYDLEKLRNKGDASL
jgi:hypothetical protein